MESPGDPGDGFPSKRAKTDPYSPYTTQCLILARGQLPDDVYSNFVHFMVQIRRGQRDISIDECKEIILNILDGQPRVIQAFQSFIQGHSPYHEEFLQKAIDFFKRVKTCPDISTGDYNALLRTMVDFSHSTTMATKDVFEEVKGLIGNNTELLQEFKSFVPDYIRATLKNEQSCRSPKNSRGTKTVDANNKCDGIRVKETNRRNEVPQLKYTQDQNQNHQGKYYSLRHKQNKRTTGLIENPKEEGDDESPHVELEDDEEYNTEPLHQWIISRLDKLPPKVDLSNGKQCTPSYCLLPKNCVTLQSSYQTELARSILNDSLVSVTSGSEDCFRFRTKNQYEENMFKCEDDLFESDMVLERFRATVHFIEDLQVRVGRNAKIQEHLTPLHKRCIEQLYDDSGIDMLDALSESENTSSALVVVLSRLNQKIGDLSEARLSLNKICSDTVANNYHRSLDLRSPSFKQLDMKRMNPKALLAEDKQISKTKSHTDIHIHEDIGNIINYAYSRSRTTEDKTMMNWTELVKAFLPVKFQWPDLKDRVARKKVSERRGMSKDFLSNIPDAVLTDEFVLSSKRVESPRVKSSEPTSSLDHFDAEVEEGEFIPDVENIRSCVQCFPNNNSTHSTSGHWNESEEHYESKEDSNNEVGSSAYFSSRLCMRDYYFLRFIIFKEKLCNLIDGSNDNWSFEQPNSYICKIHPSHEDSSVLQQQDKLRTNSLNDPALLARRINLSKELLHHQNANGSSIELSTHDREEGIGSNPHSDTGRVKQNHFQRRRKRTMENGAPSFSQLGPEN